LLIIANENSPRQSKARPQSSDRNGRDHSVGDE
jgi:hypothetical protein